MKFSFSTSKILKVFVFIASVFITRVSLAQVLNLTVQSPSVVCINQTFTVNVTATYTTAPTLIWDISPGSIINIYPTPQGAQAVVTFTNCGLSTISCTAIGQSWPNLLMTYFTHTINVICQPSPTVTALASSTAVCQGFSTTINASPGASSYTWYPGGSNQSTISATAGFYTVSATWPPYGCVSSNTINIALTPPLLILGTQSSATTCITNNTTLTRKPVSLIADGATEYYWAPYNPTEMTFSTGIQTDVTTSVNTCYTVTGLTAACSGFTTICVNVIPRFPIDVVPANPLVCQGSTVNLGVTLANGNPASPGYTCQWTEGANNPGSLSSTSGATVNAFPLNTTTYTVEAVNLQSCISLPKTVTLTTGPCTDLNDLSIKVNNIRVYPNPVNDKIFISAEITTEATIEILNVLGEPVLPEKILLANHLQTGLDLSHLQTGIYFIKVNDNQISHLTRFLKN